MAEDYMTSTSTASSDTDQSHPTRFEKILRVFIAIVALCLIGELIWLLGISPFRPFTRIDVNSTGGISREEILGWAGITANSSFANTDARAIEAALVNIGPIESARVFKSFPSRLQIAVQGRRPVAAALATVQGRTVPVLFDSQGVIFHIGASGRAFVGMLPVVSGLIIEEPYLGMRLPAMFTPFFRELENVGMSAPELLGAISEIRINPRPFDTFDLILYPVHERIRVRLSELNEDSLRYTLLMVDVLSMNGSEIDIFDFRSGIASFIPQEASP